MANSNLIDSKGWQAMNRIGALSNMYHILSDNWKEVLDEINLIKKSKNSILELQNDTSLSRKIFNFLASCKSMVDFYRKASQFYENTDFKTVLEVKHSEYFSKNELCVFISDLRNCQLHSSTITTFMSKNMQIIYFIDDLLKYGKWNAKSKKYMAKYTDYIVIESVFEEYFLYIKEFYKWFYAEIIKFHKQDFIETKSILNPNNPYEQRLIPIYQSVIVNKTVDLDKT